MVLSFFFDFLLAPNISTKEKKKKKIREIKAQRSKVMDVMSHEV